MAIEILGEWSDGYVMDYHTLYSNYIGDDDFGHPMYDTKRTKLGELVYQMKYRGKYDAIDEIIELISDFVVENWFGAVNCVVPVPPTKVRDVQPAFLLAEDIAALLKCQYNCEVLEKNSPIQAKNSTSSIQGSISKQKYAKKKTHILLVDDLFSTGATANECAKILKTDPNITDVSFLAITKTKKG